AEIDLDRAQLPDPPEAVLERILDFRPVEGALAGRNLVLAARALERIDQRRLGLVPGRVRADPLFRPGRDSVDDIVETEVAIHLLQQRREEIGRASCRER